MSNDRIEMAERMENLARMLTEKPQATVSCEELMRAPAIVRGWSPADDLAYAIAIAHEILVRSLTSRPHVGKYAGSRKAKVLEGVALLTRDERLFPEQGAWLYQLARTAPQEVLLAAAAIAVRDAQDALGEGREGDAKALLKENGPVFALVQGAEVAAKVAASVAKLGSAKGKKAGGADRTEMVFILDRSGSMATMAGSTIQGFNDLIAKQRALPGEARVSTVLFDDRYEVLHDHLPLREVPVLTNREYVVRGSTALLDAVGRAITHMVDVQRHTPPAKQAKHVFFAIITDGYENASRLFSAREVKAMVDKEQKDYGWEFVFLGANIDAIAAAGDIGIRADRAVDFVADDIGAMENFSAVAELAGAVREGNADSLQWRSGVDADYVARSGKGKR